MTQYLPPNLLALFAPRDNLQHLAPLDTPPWERKPWPYNGVSQCLGLFEDPSDTPAATRGETKEERIARKRQARDERHKANLEEKIAEWDPNKDENTEGDPFKTLFVGRINFDTSDSKLRREFEQYGPIKKISVVMNKQMGKQRGYAFIVYEKERDMHSAYKNADGKKIDGKRVVVDVERGRTVKTWKPRRLGGGLGGTRRGTPQENIKYSGRVDERDMDHSERESHKDRDRPDREGDREREREKIRDRDREQRRERSREMGERGERGERFERERDRRSRSRDKEKRERPRDRGERDGGRRERSRSREKRDRREKDKSHEKGKDKDKDKEKEREKDKERSKDRNARRDKERGRDKDREKSSRDKGKEREKDRERERGIAIKKEIKTEYLEDGEMRDDDPLNGGEQMET